MANMSFDEFKETIAEEIKAFLPDKYEDADIQINTVHKNNEELTGITIRTGETNIAPNIYLDSYYESYLDGESLEDIMQNIADVRVEHEIEKPLDVDMITDYEKAKDRILPKIVGMEGNEKYLEDKPFTQMEDLAVVYYVDMGRLGGGTMSSPITENLMNSWGVTQEELHQTALSNMEAKSASSFKSMQEVMMEMMLPDMAERFGGDMDAARDEISSMLPPDEGAMYVLTNQEKLNGATALLDAKIMGEISEKFGENFFNSDLVVSLKFDLTVFSGSSTSTFCFKSLCEIFNIYIVFIYTLDNSHEFSKSSPYSKHFQRLNFTCKVIACTKFFRKPTYITNF